MTLGPEVDESEDDALGAIKSLGPISAEDSEKLCQSVTKKDIGIYK